MSWLTVALGIALILGVLFEALETMLLPRRISRAFRATRLFVHALSLRFLSSTFANFTVVFARRAGRSDGHAG